MKVLSTYYGVGNNKIDVDMYSYTYGGIQRTTTVMNMGMDSMGKKMCLQMGDHANVANGFYDIGYMGVKLDITDPSVFNLPKPCQHL